MEIAGSGIVLLLMTFETLLSLYQPAPRSASQQKTWCVAHLLGMALY